jgi:branched-chain amino acid transport system permease protein
LWKEEEGVAAPVSVQTVVDAVALGLMYALVALGIALLFGVMRLVNFAYGELITAAAYVLYLTRSAGVGLRIVAALAAAIALAALMELAFRPVRTASPSTALMATFATSFVLQNVAVARFGTQGSTIDFLPELNQAITIGDVRIRWITVLSLGLGAVLLAAMAFVLRRTDLGLQMRATAADLRTARTVGVRVNRVMIVAFLTAGALAGVVALVLAVQRPLVTPSYGFLVMVPALVGVVVGGMDRLVAGTLGGFLVGAATVVLGAVLPPSSRVFLNSALFALVILVLLARPRGIFVRGGDALERL